MIISGFDEFKPSPFYLTLLPILFFLNKSIKKALAPPKLEVIANQQRYYKDTLSQKVVKFYEVRKTKKRNRIDVSVNIENKKLIINGVIRPQFFINYFDFKGTKIKSVSELDKNEVFKIVFNKLKELIFDLEVQVNYDKELKKNSFIAEFFCWIYGSVTHQNLI